MTVTATAELGCRLDHIAVIAPSLEAGNDWVEACLGVRPLPGGAHPEMATHNHLLRLGSDFFLEVIAVDPGRAKPAHHRWFGLDDQVALERHWREGRRLRGMVARTTALAATIALAPDLLGAPMRVTRGTREWQFGVRADGDLPLGGAVPHVMDWGAQGPAGPRLQDQGCRLLALVAEVPELATAGPVWSRLRIAEAPILRQGAQLPRLIAAVETPTGVRLLT